MTGWLANPLPAWAPNAHPLVVHFPIALLLTAAAIDVAGWLLRCNRALRFVATTLYVAGTIAVGVAYYTGRAAAATAWMPGMAHALVQEHWDWAFRTVSFFGVVTLLRLVVLWRFREQTRPVVIAALAMCGLLGALLLGETGDRGGRLVYEQGVGVAKR